MTSQSSPRIVRDAVHLVLYIALCVSLGLAHNGCAQDVLLGEHTPDAQAQVTAADSTASGAPSSVASEAPQVPTADAGDAGFRGPPWLPDEGPRDDEMRDWSENGPFGPDMGEFGAADDRASLPDRADAGAPRSP